MPLLRAWPVFYLLRVITAFGNPLHSCVSSNGNHRLAEKQLRLVQ